MSARHTALLVWAVCVGAALATLVLLALGAGESTPGDSFGLGGFGGLSFVFASLAFGTVGALVAARVPGNPIGVVLCVLGVTVGLGDLAYQYADYALFVSPSLPRGRSGGVAAEPRPAAGASACSPWHCCCSRTVACRRAGGGPHSGSRSSASR